MDSMTDADEDLPELLNCPYPIYAEATRKLYDELQMMCAPPLSRLATGPDLRLLQPSNLPEARAFR